MRANSESRRKQLRKRKEAKGMRPFGLVQKPSMRLPEFVTEFTLRAGQVLRARTAALALAHGERLETVLANDLEGRKGEFDWKILNEGMTKLAASRKGIIEGSAAEVLDERFSSWRRIWFMRLTGTDGDLLGA